ncbi:piRNA biogenesis protein EXD1 [Tribolium castaneum]|uniref:Exonuclease 3'-5' domain-containing protein 1-like Protein n=1 Tax=Tribolium castaneum TaxID=7070 RepID=D1ZZ94_TRICA|nr:PREDICTED: exonuclease 3'-5' domain-containing protein 1 [Tribolium castaneum]EFA02334.1 Exonuclease 3'-5' domain-containing protein 1-like Protein [Tribolium castaneum]|eukprot:XP_001811750.1 PREDICTED: exonuclease 3'-5' domain-containing protein 1 [Tribolium castaneum]
MTVQLKPGDRVLLENRSSEVYAGTIEYISAKSVNLHTITCHSTNIEYEGNMTFYRNEVVKIVPISDTEPASTPDETPEVSEDSLLRSRKINMHPDEFARLRQVTFDFVFIDTFGTQFENAVEVLNNRESVAVAVLGNYGRNKPMSVLVMADFKQVFIFDMLCLGKLKTLREVLESGYICKVVHDGGALFDCLYHKYGVEMKNIFDTQAVDSMLSKENDDVEIKRNISECLTYHFNFPAALLSAVLETMNDKTWFIRPLTKSDKIKSAQLVAYLLSLRDQLMKQILKKYTDVIAKDYGRYKQMSDIEVLKLRKQ